MDRWGDCSSSCPNPTGSRKKLYEWAGDWRPHRTRTALVGLSRLNTKNQSTPLPRVRHHLRSASPHPTAHGGRNPRALGIVIILVAKALNPSRAPFRDPNRTFPRRRHGPQSRCPLRLLRRQAPVRAGPAPVPGALAPLRGAPVRAHRPRHRRRRPPSSGRGRI